MTSYFINIKVRGEELQKIMSDLDSAQETILQCYSRLKDLGVLEIRTKEAASGN